METDLAAWERTTSWSARTTRKTHAGSCTIPMSHNEYSALAVPRVFDAQMALRVRELSAATRSLSVGRDGAVAADLVVDSGDNPI